MITLLIRLILLRVQQTQARGRTNVDTFVTFKFQVTNKVQNRVSKAGLTPGPLNQLNCTLPEISIIPRVSNSSPDARLHSCSKAWGNSFENVLRPIPVDKLPRKEQLSMHDYRKQGTQERLGSVMDGAVKAMKSDVVFEATLSDLARSLCENPLGNFPEFYSTSMEKFKLSDKDTVVAMQTNPQGNRQRETQAWHSFGHPSFQSPTLQDTGCYWNLRLNWFITSLAGSSCD